MSSRCCQILSLAGDSDLYIRAVFVFFVLVFFYVRLREFFFFKCFGGIYLISRKYICGNARKKKKPIYVGKVVERDRL